MVDGGAAHDPPAESIGRIRMAEDDAPLSADPAGDTPEGNGWSPVGIGLAVLVVLIMIGALVVILWAAFQTRL